MKHFVKTRLRGSRRPPDVVARLVAGIDSGHLQRDVRLDRGRQVGRPLPPVRPGPSSRRRARSRSRASGRCSGSRRPSTWSQKRCSAIMVAFDSSSPTHHPPGCCSSSSRPAAASTARSRRVSSCDGGHPADARAARATPLRTAASIVAGQSEASPGAGEVDVRLEVSIVQRNLRVPGRAAKVARGSRLTRDQRSSASPRRSVRASATRSTRPRPRTSSSSGAPLDDDRQVLAAASGRWPVSAPRSKTQCAGLSSRAASRCCRIGGRTAVDADDRRVLERGRLDAEQARRLGRAGRRGRPCRRRRRRATRPASRA